MMPKDALGGETQREVVAGNLVHGKDVQHCGVNEEIDQDNGEQAREDGAGNEAAGILDFVAEVDDTIPAVVGEDGRLYTQEQSGDERRAEGHGRLGEGSGFRRPAKMTAERETSDDHNEKNEALENRREALNLATHADAFPLEDGKEDDDRDGGDLSFGMFGRSGERRARISRNEPVSWKE